MQPVPFRLAQCIRVAFTASRARPHRPTVRSNFSTLSNQKRPGLLNEIRTQASFYSQRSDAGSQSHRNVLEPEPRSSADAPSDLGDGHHRPTPAASSSTSKVPNELPSHSESRRTDLSKSFSHLMDHMQSNIFTASQRLNDLTGYSGIEALKKSIEQQEELVASTRQAVKAGRSAYSAAVATRSATQREVNDLLQRKHNWTPSDLERFTALYRSDHANEQAEQRAHDELGRYERSAEEASNALAKSILARYHEEQIWSDKIRQMSTWGTWGLMGVNVLLFLVFQVAVEPWRRKRLVQGFEDKVMEALEREKVDITPAAAAAAALAAAAATAPAPFLEKAANPPDPPPPENQPDVIDALIDAAQHAAPLSVIDAVSPTASTSSALETGPEIVDTASAIEPARSNSDDSAIPLTNRPAEPKTGYGYYEEAFRELFSEKRVEMTQREVTAAVLQGAAGGAALMGLLLVLLRPR